MRFMIIRKADKNTEAGILPEEKLLAAMGKYNEELVQAGAMCAGEGLQPSAEGTRLKYSRGEPTMIDGPFAETKELIAGFSIIDVKSKQEAIEWVKRWPAFDGDGQVEIEIREVGCPGGLSGVSASESSASMASSSKPEDAKLLRFMVILKADEKAEAGVIPDDKILSAMGRHNDESVKAGIMLAGNGLQPSSRGARVKFAAGKPSVIDGPFSEAKELIAGYWIIQTKSKQEAIEWAKCYPYPFGAEAEIEIRQLVEASDFGAAFTPELREQEERMREHLLPSGK